ncbi:hypothetical protein LCGC14_0245730 [marine sediment metagenome]|uniref:Uncharacterized protein n=1 Tax=marine sediment metagenome TaxID=412755 RepID=A0A0F9UME2_9ZZZZ
MITLNSKELRKFNINRDIYIQINEKGWTHLRKTVGEEYIKHCITTEAYRREIDGEVWYKLQCHTVFELLPTGVGLSTLFNTNIMFDDESLIKKSIETSPEVLDEESFSW